MKQKILSLVALIVAFCAFCACVALLINGIVKDLPDVGAYVFQLIATTLILLLCIGNFLYVMYSLKGEKNTDEKIDNPPTEETAP